MRRKLVLVGKGKLAVLGSLLNDYAFVAQGCPPNLGTDKSSTSITWSRRRGILRAPRSHPGSLGSERFSSLKLSVSVWKCNSAAGLGFTRCHKPRHSTLGAE